MKEERSVRNAEACSVWHHVRTMFVMNQTKQRQQTSATKAVSSKKNFDFLILFFFSFFHPQVCTGGVFQENSLGQKLRLDSGASAQQSTLSGVVFVFLHNELKRRQIRPPVSVL